MREFAVILADPQHFLAVERRHQAAFNTIITFMAFTTLLVWYFYSPASAAFLDASGAEVQTWKQVSDTSYMPTAFYFGCLAALLTWLFMGFFRGVMVFAACVFGSFMYKLRTPLINNAT